MKSFFPYGRWLRLLLLGLLLVSACQRHPYRIADPKGPPQPKAKRGRAPSNESADGGALDVEREAMRTEKNRLDKHGLVKKPKYEQRRLKRKTGGVRKFLGITLPFQK